MLFMPHCDLDLYENILRENWSQDKLQNLFFICNNLAEYVEKYGPFFRSQIKYLHFHTAILCIDWQRRRHVYYVWVSL
jgi:hypothetical protein